VTSNLALAGVVIALAIYVIWLLVRQSRARGNAEAEAKAATIDQETAADVAEIQARPIPLRHAVLERMRDQPPT
jgi:hypothetical protein